jgi:cysteine synthase B
MMGTGGFLREKKPGVRLVGVQPDSPLHGLEGLKHLATTAHLPALYDPAVPDAVVELPTELADRTARWLARETGYLVGWSAGAAVAAGLDILKNDPEAYVVVIGCDTGTRYLSEPHRWSSP